MKKNHNFPLSIIIYNIFLFKMQKLFIVFHKYLNKLIEERRNGK